MVSKTVLLALAAAHAPVVAPTENHASVRLVTGPTASERAGERWIGLTFHLAPGWHVYWRNPGDAGSPPSVVWTLPAGWSMGELQWPLPERIEVPPLTAFGYEHDVVFPMRLRTPAAGAGTIAGRVRWVACRIECVAEEDSVMLRFDAALRATAADSARVAASIAQLPVTQPASWRLEAHASGDKVILSVDGAPLTALSRADFFPAEPGILEHSAKVDVNVDRGTLTLGLTGSRYSSAPPRSLRGLLVLRVAGADSDAKSYDVDVAVASGPAPQTNAAAPMMLLIVALLSGIVINIMPCVFPLLAVKTLSLVTAGDRRMRATRAVMYLAGSIASSIALGALFLSARSTGSAMWGSQLQSPSFLALLALLTFLASLSLLGVWEVPSLVLFRPAANTKEVAPIVGAFTMGAAAMLVGAPCTAPLFGATLAGALTAPTPLGLAAFAMFGVGAGFPLALLMVAPGLADRLPRAGRWMETVKQVLAFPLLGVTAWLIWVAQLETGAHGSAILLGALCTLGFAAWIVGRWCGAASPPTARRVALATGLALASVAIAGVATLGATTHDAADTMDGLRWQAYSDARLDSLRAAGMPVFIDFTAAWCLTCKVNEMGTLHSSRVADAFRANSVALLRADLTVNDSIITRALHHVGGSSVPTYAVYASDASAGVRLLPALLTPGVVVDAIARASSAPRVAVTPSPNL